MLKLNSSIEEFPQFSKTNIDVLQLVGGNTFDVGVFSDVSDGSYLLLQIPSPSSSTNKC